MAGFINRFVQERLIETTLQESDKNNIYNERKNKMLTLIKELKGNELFLKYEELSNQNINELLIETYKQGFVDGIKIQKEFAKVAQRSI